MRTEQLLRETLQDLANQARTPEVVMTRIAGRLGRPTERRRWTLVLALAAVVVLALAIVVPTFLANRTAVPVDQRVKGNWNLIHRVELPPGWEVKAQAVSPDSESTNLGEPMSGNDEPEGCTVDVFGRGRGDPTAGRTDRTPVTVNGRAGFYVDSSPAGDLGGVSWEYQPGAFAVVSCGDGRPAEAVAMAERVRFEPVPVRLPFRLRSLPQGYEARVLTLPLTNSQETWSLGAVQFVSATESDERPGFAVWVENGQTEIPPGLPGWESDTIGGTPAVLSAWEAKLCLNPGTHTACIQATVGEAADPARSYWAAGRRELLIDVAKGLVLADDVDDPGTWFQANRVIPS